MRDGEGLPGEFLLLTTVLIWLLFAVIYIGNRKSKINQWCLICGLFYSVGALKEYLYYTLFPWIAERAPALLDNGRALAVYSVLTAVPYYFATPALFIMALYFSRMELRCPSVFPWISILSFVPGILLGIRYPFPETRYYQLNDKTYYGIVILYNLVFAAAATVLFVTALHRENNPKIKRQKLAIASLVLLPGWFTILTTMPVQFFGVTGAEKAWQGNLLIIVVLILVWFYMVLNDGFMGSRLKHETYKWDQEERLMSRTVDMVRHMLKNQISKIEWCARNIESRTEDGDMAEYAGIIRRSARRMTEFLSGIRENGMETACRPEAVEALELFRGTLSDFEKRYPEVSFEVQCESGTKILCDRELVREVLVNLFQNSIEAMGEKGRLTVRYTEGRGRLSCIRILDTGCGLPGQNREQIFLPYYTTKESENHWGMGLYYCQKVLAAHGGSIRAKDRPEGGAAFLLFFPRKRKKKERNRQHGTEENPGADRGR